MNHKFLSIKCFPYLLMALFFGSTLVTGTVSAASSDIVIERVEAVIQNIDPSFYPGSFDPNTPRLYYNFFIYIKDLNNNIKKIKTVQVINMYDLGWTIDPKNEFNPELGYIGGWGKWYDISLSSNGSALCLKDLTVVITTRKDTYTYSFSVAAPGATSPAYSFVYSEDYKGKVTVAHVPALKCGKITSVSFKDYLYTIDFTINDPNVVNGQICFYDQDMHYLGESKYFINAYSGEVDSNLNGGKELFVDGRVNHYTFDLGKVDKMELKELLKTKYIVFVAQDGKQFSGTKTPDKYCYESFSERAEVR